MKNRISGLYLKIISFFLVLLGFSACGDDDENDPTICLYGSPSAKYTVKGKVVSAENKDNPIRNIRVVLIDNVDESKYDYIPGDTVTTDNEGQFEVQRHYFPAIDNKLKIKFEDVDGEENGLFLDKEEVIDFKEINPVDEGTWYKGEFIKDMNTVELSPKTEDDNTASE